MNESCLISGALAMAEAVDGEAVALLQLGAKPHRDAAAGHSKGAPDYTIRSLRFPGSDTISHVFGATFYPGAGNRTFVVSDLDSVRRVDLERGTVDVLLEEPGGIFRKAAIDPQTGDVFAVAQARSVLMRIDGTSGNASILAGTFNTSGCSGDGGLAVDALLDWPHSVTIHPATGDLYIPDANNQAVRRIDRSTGIITTVAGTLCEAGSSGDGGPATMAKLYHPPWVEFDPATNDMFIADYNNSAVRRVDAETGVISTFAGTPGVGGDPTGDGGLATSAALGPPSGFTFHPVTHDVFISIYEPVHIVRRVSRSTGIITTVAGTPGVEGYSGDLGPARNATFHTPQCPSADPATGEVWVPDQHNRVIRILSP